MAKILGLDLGNAQTQTSEGVKFESRYKTGFVEMNKMDVKVEYNDRQFTIGDQDGSPIIGNDRHEKESYEAILLAAIAKSYPDDALIECNVVAGLPAERFNHEPSKEALKAKLKTMKQKQFKLNGVTKEVTILDADVFCESGIVFGDRDAYRDKETLVIDIGGLTIDITQWAGLKLKSYKTYKKGMANLFGQITTKINTTHGCSLNPETGRKIIGKSKYKINQEMKDVSFSAEVVKNYVELLTAYVRENFTLEDVDDIVIIGGGAVALYEDIKKSFPTADLAPKAEFANANAYAEVGKMIWD